MAGAWVGYGACPDLQVKLGLSQGTPKTTYQVINTGRLPIMLGGLYQLERLTGDAWAPVAGPRAFAAWGKRLEPGGRFELLAAIPESAPPGRYRLRKPVGVVEVTAEFEVIAD